MLRNVKDPVATMERIYERMNWVEKQIAKLETEGDPLRMLGYYRNSLRGLKASKTTLIRYYF